MLCPCGSTLMKTGGKSICLRCKRQHVECPSCGGGISTSPEAVLITCPYCQSSLRHEKLSGEPPYFPVNLSQEEARKALLEFLLNRFGIPGDFQILQESWLLTTTEHEQSLGPHAAW